MQFDAASAPPWTFFIVCHFLLILHYIKHGIAVMYGLSDGQTFPAASNPKKSEIEFVILFMRVHVHSIDTEINRWSLRMIRNLQKYKDPL